MTTKYFSMAVGAVGLLGAAMVTAPRWTASLSGTDGSMVAGTATVEAAMASMSKPMDSTMKAEPAKAFNASVSITGAKANAMLAWHVHEGKCGAGGAIVGTDAAYPDIKVDGKGAGTASANVTRDLTEGQDYSVSVHNGDTDAAPPTACGDLHASSKSGVTER